MQCARSGSISFLCMLAVSAWFAACGLQGEGTGPIAPDDDDDAPTGVRRDGGLDAAVDARTKPTPDDPPPVDATVADAFIPVGDASFDARVPPPDASHDAAVDTGAPDAAGPVCSVPGSYAALVDFNVAWIPTTLGGVLPVLKGGQGSIRMIATVKLDATGGALVEPCGTTVPDFEGADIVGAELYGGDIPVEAWDAVTMPSFRTRWATSCDRPGCSYLGDEATLVIGARPVAEGALWPAPGAWVESGQYEATDDDDDGRPGLTMITRGPPMTNADGRPYSYPPVGIAQFGRARKLHLAMSLRVKLSGTLHTCDEISGSSSSAEVHVSAIGCTGVLEGDVEELLCDPETSRFVDKNLPMWTVNDSAFKMVRLPPGGGCYTARTLLQ
jgi:hypothetical protein